VRFYECTSREIQPEASIDDVGDEKSQRNGQELKLDEHVEV